MEVKVEPGSALGEGRVMRGSLRDNGRKRGGPRHIVSREKEETKKRYRTRSSQPSISMRHSHKLHTLNDIWPGMAGASGAVARSTAAVWLRHVTTWSTTRRPGLPRLGKTLRDVDFRWLPLSKGHGSTPSLQLLINVGHRQQAVLQFPRTR